MCNILVTCGGGFQGLSIYKSLENIPNIATYLWDSNEDNLSKYFFDFSFFSPPIEKNSHIYQSQLYDYVKKNNIHYIFPATVYDLHILSQIKTKFLSDLSCIIIIPDTKYINIFNNKLLTYKLFEEIQLPIQTLMNPKEYTSTLLGKPNIGWGGNGIQKINSPNDLKRIEVSDYHFVEFLSSFEEYSIDFSVNSNGVCCTPILRKRIMVSGGYAVIMDTKSIYYEKYSKYLHKIKDFFSNTQLSGIYNIQFLTTGDSIYFTDLNSRIGTSAIMGNYKQQSILSHIFKTNNQATVQNLKSIRTLTETHIPYINTSAIKAIVFDLDDTLISQKIFILDRCIKLYNETDFFTISLEEFKIEVLALLNEGKAPYLIDELCKKYNILEKKEQILSAYQSLFPNSLYIYPGVITTLKYLKEKGFLLFILTDNSYQTKNKKIELFTNSDIFDKIYYNEKTTNMKPAMHSFSKIAIENNIRVDQIAMVGDNEYRDILGAINSGYSLSFHIRHSDGMVSHSLFKDIFNKYDNKIIQISEISNLKYYF